MNAKYFVPLETAKLLKEKGYPQEFADWYYHESADELAFVHNRYVPERVVTGKPTELGIWYIAAPTYHEVVDWLEEKGIWVSVTNRPWGTWFASVEERDKPQEKGYDTDDYSTREEALQAAILKALEML